MAKMSPGKLPYDFLEKLLNTYKGTTDHRLLIGPKIGEDAAVIDFGDRYLVTTIDPITLASEEIGWYAVHVNANDVAVRGARPRWFQAAILLPENFGKKKIERIFYDISTACQELGISLAGGHTELSYDLPRPIVIGCMMGEVEKEKLVTTSGAKPGDQIILTKGIAIEGTAIIAREKEKELKKAGYGSDWIARCQDFLYDPGISVVKDALLANETAHVHSMHDPTEGGLAAGLYEIARASGTGLLIYKDKIPILEQSKELCQHYHIDPLRTITSGSLLITAKPAEAEKILEVYKKAGTTASIIGEIKPKSHGMKIVDKYRSSNLRYSERDEITKIL
jgi:thiamin-phosphate kinase